MIDHAFFFLVTSFWLAKQRPCLKLAVQALPAHMQSANKPESLQACSMAIKPLKNPTYNRKVSGLWIWNFRGKKKKLSENKSFFLLHMHHDTSNISVAIDAHKFLQAEVRVLKHCSATCVFGTSWTTSRACRPLQLLKGWWIHKVKGMWNSQSEMKYNCEFYFPECWWFWQWVHCTYFINVFKYIEWKIDLMKWDMF